MLEPEFMLEPELEFDIEDEDVVEDDEAAGALAAGADEAAGAAELPAGALMSLSDFELLRLFFLEVVPASVELLCEEPILSLFFMLESPLADVSLEPIAEASDFLCFFDFLPVVEVSLWALVVSVAAELLVALWSVELFFDFFFFLVCVLVSGVVVWSVELCAYVTIGVSISASNVDSSRVCKRRCLRMFIVSLANWKRPDQAKCDSKGRLQRLGCSNEV